MSGNKVILKIKPRNKINMQVLPPSLSLTDVERAENAANIAMAWAQDDESPDGENDTDSLTGKTQSSKSWALNAKNDALSAAASASAAATSETNAANSEDKAQAWAESETSPDGEPDSKSAKTWAGDSADSAELAQKWAESETSPDGEDDADSPTGDTMSAKEWALYAKQLALQIGNPVVEVTESDGTVTVEKSDGTTNSFKAGINILQRNKTYAVEDIAYSFGLPSWAYLECTEAGTTAATEPSFASATTPGTYVTDGTAEFILCDMRDGTPVGRVVYAETLQDGYLKYNGATVSRSDYKRPCRYATKKNLFL